MFDKKKKKKILSWQTLRLNRLEPPSGTHHSRAVYSVVTAHTLVLSFDFNGINIAFPVCCVSDEDFKALNDTYIIYSNSNTFFLNCSAQMHVTVIQLVYEVVFNWIKGMCVYHK